MVNKSPVQIERILGKPTRSFKEPTNPSNQMELFAVGEKTTIEYHLGITDSVVIFFNQDNLDKETAYALVGLNCGQDLPQGIRNVRTGNNWAKIKF